jgi:cysteinyl-tRNA synthetase
MKLYNSLTRNLEKFVPINPNSIKIYVCGPTVYDRPHIGNARSVVVYDILYRLLIEIYGFHHVLYVRNITDVDDKINARAIELGVSIQDLTSVVYRQFTEDMSYLGCLRPSHEPKATEHISEMIEIIEKLISNNFAYVSDDGNVYFDVAKMSAYNKLSGRNLEDLEHGMRIEIRDSKRSPHDFVLWKPVSKNDDISSIFESPWGRGRPGWHIECSAMSTKFLGHDFDIHGGGVDLIFPHHTNEIAQSVCAFPGTNYAKYWVHNGFLTVNGEKMSKSLGNFFSIEDLRNKDIDGEVIRLFFISTHYRKPIDFTDKALHDAGAMLDYMYRALDGVKNDESIVPKEFLDILQHDLNTSLAISFMHNLAKEIFKTEDHSRKQILQSQLKVCGKLMGILQNSNWFFKKTLDINMVNKLILDRAEAKKTKNFTLADKIRDHLNDLGVELEDHKDGTTSWRAR